MTAAKAMTSMSNAAETMIFSALMPDWMHETGIAHLRHIVSGNLFLRGP